jgi:hypothetical protein
MQLFIPTADSIPVAWGWFQFLLLLTFPLHLLAMNAMVGGLAIGIYQHFKNDQPGRGLAHRIAVMLPLVIAFVVNLGVAPLLFLQVLYGHFIYTSSILMGLFWISIIPVLIIGYYGAYLYDFQFKRLGSAGPWLGLMILAILLCIGYFFANNMLLMSLPERFGAYFEHRNGTLLASDSSMFMPRYLHMMAGALAVGGLFVALLGRFRAERDPELAERALQAGMRTFFMLTLVNICFGVWYLLSLERQTMLLFMGRNLGATISFSLALLLAAAVLVTSYRRQLYATLAATVALVYLMSFLRAWLRTDLLAEYFDLGQLQVVPQYSPLVFFLVCLVVGAGCVVWLLVKTATALAAE